MTSWSPSACSSATQKLATFSCSSEAMMAPGGCRAVASSPARRSSRQRDAGYSARHRPAEGGVTDMDDPRHVFLDARRDAPLRLGQDQGLPEPQGPDLVPPPVMTHPDRWRLDQLLAWGGEAHRAGRGGAGGDGRTRPGTGERHRPAPPTHATTASRVVEISATPSREPATRTALSCQQALNSYRSVMSSVSQLS